jgi:thioredoxin-dependent peroxiredoxin
MIEPGSKAPEFTLPDQDGNPVSLSGFKGKYVVLYFYPKDNTHGCTKEACNFRDEFPLFKNLNAEIIGISTDSVKSHKKFAEKYNLPFTLLSDQDKDVVQQYGVWKEKNLFGVISLGVKRTTYIIDKEGIIRKVFPKVKVDEHNREVEEALKEL